LLGPIGVNVNSITIARHILKDLGERNAIADTRIDSGEFVWKVQAMFEAFCFGNRKWEETKLCLDGRISVDLGRFVFVK